MCTSRQAPRFLPCGDTALCVEFGDNIDRHVSALVLALADRLEAASMPGIVELVPTFRSLLIHTDPSVLLQAELTAKLEPLLTGLEAAEGPGRLWRLPACYDESLAPDLAEVASRTGLTPHQVAERHSAVTYHVYMVGFLPGYPYMGICRRSSRCRAGKIRDQSAARLHRHRHHNDRRLPAGKPRWLAPHRANAPSALGLAPRPARSVRALATKWYSSPCRSETTRHCWPGLPQASSGWN